MGLDKALFLSSPTPFECGMCLEVAYPAILFPCGNEHPFCQSCIANIDVCPLCNIRKNRSLLPLTGLSLRMYNALKLKCPNNCSWDGSIHDLGQHQEICPMLVVPCPWMEFGCTHVGLRSALAAHNAVATHLELTRIKVTEHKDIIAQMNIKMDELFAQIKDSKVMNKLVFESEWLAVPSGSQLIAIHHNLNSKQFSQIQCYFSKEKEGNAIIYLDFVTSSGTGAYGLEFFAEDNNTLYARSFQDGSSFGYAFGGVAPFFKVKLVA